MSSLGEAGVSLAVLFDREARTVALIRPVASTVGLNVGLDLTAVVVLLLCRCLGRFLPTDGSHGLFHAGLDGLGPDNLALLALVGFVVAFGFF